MACENRRVLRRVYQGMWFVVIKPTPPELDLISQRLVSARANAEPLAHFPGDLPTSLDAAYTVQSASIERWPDTIIGWKVGLVPPGYRDALAAERLCGPIFASSVHRVASGASRVVPIFDGGFAAVEAEFVFRLGVTIPPVERDYSDDELAELIADLHVGIEMASSPMADVNRLGPCCVVCDFGNNAGLLVGPAISNWRARTAESLVVSVSVDGEQVGKASAATIEGGLLQAFRFLVTVCARRGITLDEGTFVSCGAVTGIHDVTVDSTSVVTFEDAGDFSLSFKPIAAANGQAVSVKG